MAPKRPVIIDCDPGVDDALALILALNSPELDVRAVTTVCGNVTVDQACRNASFVLNLVRRAQRPPLARGAERPLRKEFADATYVHGNDGLGGLDRFRSSGGGPKYPREEPVIGELPAWELTRSIVEAEPGEVTLIAIGPLTNAAVLQSNSPEALQQVKELVVMGGSYGGPGNVTAHAEFNFWVDPHAAEAVLSSGIPITCIGLDLTHRVRLLSGEIETRIRPRGTPISEFVCDATEHTIAFHKEKHGFDGMHIHDALAVAYAARPGLFETEELAVRVECDDPVRIGAVEVVAGGESNVRAATAIDQEGFFGLFFERLSAGPW